MMVHFIGARAFPSGVSWLYIAKRVQTTTPKSAVSRYRSLAPWNVVRGGRSSETSPFRGSRGLGDLTPKLPDSKRPAQFRDSWEHARR